MASKSRSNKPLEWVMGSPGILAGGAADEEETARISLGLKDDEVAEIHKVLLVSILVEDFDAGKIITLIHWLSMDPDSIYAATIGTDLETIIETQHAKQAVGVHAGTETIDDISRETQYDFDPPVLVGTDLGVGLMAAASVGNLDAGSTARWRIYFTRRKANVAELNQILLKRR